MGAPFVSMKRRGYVTILVVVGCIASWFSSLVASLVIASCLSLLGFMVIEPEPAPTQEPTEHE